CERFLGGESFQSCDQMVARRTAAVNWGQRNLIGGLYPTSAQPRFRAIIQSVNKGGTCRGPCLEAQRAGGMRRFRLCRRGIAGGILSSRGQRRRQSNKLPV